MSQSTRPFIEDTDAIILAELFNRAAEKFDAGKLSLEQAFVLYLLLDQVMNALWNAHGGEFLHLYRRAMSPAYEASDEESDA